MLKRWGLKIWELVSDNPLPFHSSQEAALTAELQTTFRELAVPDSTPVPASEAAWMRNMNRLQELALTRDPRRFLRWDVVGNTMFVSYTSYISTELSFLKHSPDWNTRWRPAIQESPAGHPIPYIFYPASSGNLIHHAYHLAQLEEKTRVRAQDIGLVFEFGGGYGSMCRLFYNLGFEGRYIVYDLPPFSALQRYYLKILGLPVQSVTEFMKSKTGIVCISDTQDLKALLSESLEASDSLFLATWSISESPIRVRDSVLPLLYDFGLFLIAYQQRFGEIDNAQFFSNWKEVASRVRWNNWQIEHIPGNYYLIGKTADNQ
jgi:hypothetical protein